MYWPWQKPGGYGGGGQLPPRLAALNLCPIKVKRFVQVLCFFIFIFIPPPVLEDLVCINYWYTCAFLWHCSYATDCQANVTVLVSVKLSQNGQDICIVFVDSYVDISSGHFPSSLRLTDSLHATSNKCLVSARSHYNTYRYRVSTFVGTDGALKVQSDMQSAHLFKNCPLCPL